MYKSIIAIAAAASLSLFAGPLAATDDMDTETEMQQSGDPAGSGTINPTFDRLDTDDDGSLSEEELSQYGTPSAGPSEWKTMRAEDRAAEMMDMVDQDGDGSVSPEELEESDIFEE